MYLIRQDTNSLEALKRRNFSELGFKERAHLQEWVAGNPEVLGEPLLIIQKEFDGFEGTYERLDLLALDKQGNLVIIENKLDDSGRDVIWQALKYAAYCSTLKKEQIEDIFQDYLKSKGIEKPAAQIISEFLEDAGNSEIALNKTNSQRIFLIAANFRKEITSTALYLMNFKIQLKCFKATAYEHSGNYFLSVDQIIPVTDAQEYIISMADKIQEETATQTQLSNRHKLRYAFWTEFLKEIKGKSELFQNNIPTKEYALVAGGTDITYVSFQPTISGDYAMVALSFGKQQAELNKQMFDVLSKHRTEIDNAFGEGLEWDRKDDLIRSMVSIKKPGLSYFNQEQWPESIQFLIQNVNKLERAVRPYMQEVKLAVQKASEPQAID
jgi:hypothetical protein